MSTTDPNSDPIARAVAAIDAGELVGLPTETVYGLAADAANDSAVLSVFAAKGRPLGHPLIVHVASATELDTWSDEVTDAARRLATTMWPGPLTIILRKAAHVSEVVTGGHDTVGLRVPAHPVALGVLRALGPGRGLAAPSANRFGRVSPTTADHVRREFAARELLVLDGGPCDVGIESTIVDLSGDRPRLLRPGAISAADISSVIGVDVAHGPGGVPVAAPGTLASHYAPLARVTLVDAGADVHAVIAAARAEPPVSVWAQFGSSLARAAVSSDLVVDPMSTDPADIARELYVALRRADERRARHLLVEMPAGDDLAAAVRDRLVRAAHSSS